MHFQFAVWYFHTIPFLAWCAFCPERSIGFKWALRCTCVVALTFFVEVSFLLTTQGVVRGPPGSGWFGKQKTWVTDGVPTSKGSALLTFTHVILLGLLSRRQVHMK